MQQGNHQLSEGSLAVLRDFRLQDGQVLGNVGANRDITVQSSPDYARDPDSSGLGTRKNAVAL